MASPKKDSGFLTQDQREKLRIAVQNAETLSLASPRSPTGGSTSALLQQYEQQMLEQKRAAAAAAAAAGWGGGGGGGGGGGAGGGGGGPRHVRRSHSGKTIKVKKGEAVVLLLVTSRVLDPFLLRFACYPVVSEVAPVLCMLDDLG
jgi:hypothetical protein